MLTITADQIEQWRSELADYPEVLRSLDAIEDCEGDVEDAAIGLAIQAGLEPSNSDRWLLSFAKQFRSVVCELVGRVDRVDLTDVIRHLASDSDCPHLLILPTALAAEQDGFEVFCRGVVVELE